MAKKSKGGSVSMDLLFKLGVLVFAIAAVCMIFLVTVNFTDGDGEIYKSFTGIQQMFGYSEEGSVTGITTYYLGFSFLSLLPIILVIAGAVCAFVDNKIVGFVGVALLVVAAVMFFMMPTFASLPTLAEDVAVADKLATNTAKAIMEECTRTLGLGAILGGVFSLVSAALSAVKIVKK